MQKTSTYKLEPRNIFRKIMDHIIPAAWHLVVCAWSRTYLQKLTEGNKKLIYKGQFN